jgi:MATE family multidrug resistance protein
MSTETPGRAAGAWWDAWVRGPGGLAEVWRIALPLIVSTASLTLMQFCDRMFLAWYSGVSIRAALPAGILAFTMICGFFAVAGYGGTFVAQYHGAGDPRGCGRATAQAVLFALLSWPFILLLFLPLGRLVLAWSGHPPEVLAEERIYFDISMWGSLPSLVSTAVAGFFSGRGDTRTTMWAYTAGNLLNIPLDWLMIFGHGGFPEMGIRGAAIATVISGCVPPMILLGLYFGRATDRAFATRATFRFDRALFRRLLRFGLPSGVHLALDLTSFTLFVLLTGRFGPLAQAASNIALSINTLAFMPIIGLGIAASIVVGQYQGRREPDHAARGGWSTLILGTVYMGLIGVTYLLFPEFYVGLFSGSAQGTFRAEDLLPTVRPLLVILAIWSFTDAADIVLAGALKGAGDTRFVMAWSLAIAYGFFVAGELVIVLVLKRGLIAAWMWTCAYIVVLAAGYLWRFKRGRWKSIDLLGRGVVEALPPPGRPGADGMAVE